MSSEVEIYVTTKGRIVIPVPCAENMASRVGTRILIKDNGEEIVLQPVTKRYIQKLRGSLKGTGALDALVEERRKDKEKGQ